MEHKAIALAVYKPGSKGAFLEWQSQGDVGKIVLGGKGTYITDGGFGSGHYF